ncbi:MAG: hypothetical protein RJA99_4237 [Pseudomonadota bacterium]|jgi:hypothetical protein
MSASIERRMRAARERWIDAAGVRVKIRRPLPLELAEIHERGEVGVRAAVVAAYVVDWEVTEAQLLPGVGGDEAVPFSTGAWREFMAGRLDVFSAAANEILGWYEEHRKATEAIPGKSESS